MAVMDSTNSLEDAFTYLGYETASTLVEPERGQRVFEAVASVATGKLRGSYAQVIESIEVNDIADEIEANPEDYRSELISAGADDLVGAIR